MFSIEINTDNDAFGEIPNDEIADILTNLAKKIRHVGNLIFYDGTSLYDRNGNVVGKMRFDNISRSVE